MVISPSPSQNIERVSDNDRKYVKKSMTTSRGMVADSKKQQKDKKIVNNPNRFLRENLKILSDRKGPERGPISLRGVDDHLQSTQDCPRQPKIPRISIIASYPALILCIILTM